MLRSRLSYAGLQNVVQTLRSASSWATVQDPTALSGSNAAQAYNLGMHLPYELCVLFRDGVDESIAEQGQRATERQF